MSTVLDYAAGPMLSTSLGGGGSSVHSGHTRSRRSGSRATSPSALSAKSGSTNCSTGRLSASEIKRVLDKLKAELDNERMKNKQFVKERAVELKKSKLWFEREKQAALESIAHDLKREKERALRENDNEWRQAIKARDEEIRLLREDVKTANNTHREETPNSKTSNNEEFVLRLQKEIRSLRQLNRDLETKWKNAVRSANEKVSNPTLTSNNAGTLDTKLLRNVQDLVHDLDAQVNSEAFFTSGSVPELPETLGQLKQHLQRLSTVPEQLSSAERDRIKEMEAELKRLQSENDFIKRQQQSSEASVATNSTDAAAEEKIKKLKKRNAELVAIARRLEERLKGLQQQRRQAAPSDSAADSTAEMRHEFERQRARDLAEHAKAMLERDKALEALRRRLEATSTAANPAAFEALEGMLRTAQRERLQLEKRLTWCSQREGGGGDPGHDSLAASAAGGGEQLPILQEKLKIIAERLKTRDQENQSLEDRLETAISRVAELEKTERSLVQISRELERIRRELQAERQTRDQLERERQAVAEEKTALTVQISDLQTRVESFDKVNEEKQSMQASIADLRHALSEQQREQQVERSRMKAQMTEMEDLVQHLREVAERRRSLEHDREEMRRQLQSKEEQISALNMNKTELCRAHEETVESLRASLREMERRCELQTLQHEEAMLELEAMRKKQHYRQQQEEQQQQLRQQQQELEEAQAQRKKEQQLEEEKAAAKAAEEERRAKELEEREASLAESLSGVKPDAKLLNGSLTRGRSPTQESESVTPLRIFTAKYSYDPYHYSPNENPAAELCLKSGEYLIVHGAMDGDGFFTGEQMDGRRGLVPSNFVEPVDMAELGPDFNLSAILGRPDGASNGSDEEKSMSADRGLKGRRCTTPASAPPAPRLLKVERQLSNSVVVAWQPPAAPLLAPISAYHVYVDGQFRTAVRAVSKTRALVEGVDMRRMHRVSVRAVTASGQSKDAECTLMVGENASPCPDQVKATQITANGAKLSWLPGDSKCSHAVSVNGRDVKNLPPGDYKLHLSRLTPDTLHRVRVIARPNSASNSSSVANQLDFFAASLEFRTLPGGLVEAPIDVQVEEGPQEKTLLVTWLPVTLEEGGESNGIKVEGYIIVVNGERVRDVPGATTDHHMLPVDCILPVLGENLTSILQLTLRSRGADGSESVDSHPPVELSAQTLGRGRPSLQVLRRSGEPRSSPALRHAAQVGKSPTEEFRSLESPPLKSVAVPEIHIIGSELGHAAEFPLDEQPRLLGHGEGPRVHDRRSHRRKGHQAPGLHFEEPAGARKSAPPSRGGSAEMGEGQAWTRRADDEDAADRELEQVMSLSRHQPRPPLQAGVSPTEHLEAFAEPDWAVPPTHQQAMQAIKATTRMFVALYDYDPSTMSPNQDAVDEELPFREGQLIKVYGDRDEDGFFFAEANGRRGMVPYNMVSEVVANDETDMTTAFPRPAQAEPRITAGERMRRMVALYDYDPHELSPNVDADDMELAFCTGDVIVVFGEMDDDGFYTGECITTGRHGLVPSNFLQELPSRSPSPLPPGGANPAANTPPGQPPRRHRPADAASPRAHPCTVPHRDGRRPKAALRVSSGPGGPSPSSSVTAPGHSVSPGPLNTNYGSVITSEPEFISANSVESSNTLPKVKGEENTTSSLINARPLKAVFKPNSNSLPHLHNGTVTPAELEKGGEVKIDADLAQKRGESGSKRSKTGDMSVYNNIDLSAFQRSFGKNHKRRQSSEDGSQIFVFPPFSKREKKTSIASSVSSSRRGSPDLTPLSTPTPTKKNSPRPSITSQPGTPQTERKRSVFKNPFKKRKS